MTEKCPKCNKIHTAWFGEGGASECFLEEARLNSNDDLIKQLAEYGYNNFQADYLMFIESLFGDIALENQALYERSEICRKCSNNRCPFYKFHNIIQ